MKSKILGKDGEKGSIELPGLFSSQVREDIAQKFFEAEKKIQPYGPNPEAGKHHSASGNLSHSRRLWKTAYGKGISRVPRKIMWRRGDHFYWVGAEVSGMRGGRQAHPPKIAKFLAKKKINKKEAEIAIKSAFASTSNIDYIKRRYETLSDLKLNLPIVISSDILKLKAKEFFAFLEKNLGGSFSVALQNKEQRAGKGKMRNRRYKYNAGLLLITGKEENARFSGIDIRKISEVEVGDLWPLGRLTAYTEQAIKELSAVKEKQNKSKNKEDKK
jgi:large subunit ribosomal protein L4e